MVCIRVVDPDPEARIRKNPELFVTSGTRCFGSGNGMDFNLTVIIC
jgi:hypothetical protein